ncbi:hypothetical protein C8R43DRAFT_969235 [Mycena crocata]|nr:hypothetical protein C8R43DRAFT_969235 [Mycena crocata]
MHWRGANRSRGSPRVKRDSDRSYSSPPFPEIPEGVIITPFKDFEAHGIRRSLDSDGIERDMLGIPTIPLRFKHRDDVSKTNPNPGMRTPSAPKQFSKEWWIDWEEVEHLRIQGPYDHTVPLADLLRQGARDFQKYRDFPPGVFKTLWEVFKIYAGIMGTTPVWQRESDAEVDDDDDDLSDYDNKPFRPLRPREPYELYEVKPPIVKDDAEIQALLLAARTTRDTRAERFLASPAAASQMFLSSYMADQNLILSDRNLVNAPHLLHFFVKFLLRNKVLPDKYDDELNRALYTIEVAKKELPLTSKISKSLPDAFAAACQNRWGSSVADYTTGVDPALTAFETSLLEENIETISAETLDTEGDNSAGWNTPAPSATDWNVSGAGPQTLSALLGPTTLSLAYGPGIVERSVRRILSIDTPLSSDVTTGRLHRVETGPWAGWDADGSEDAVPAILKSDPMKRHSVENNIRLLVEPAAAEHLCVGMGLGGIWVQLSSDAAAADSVWYLEKLTRVLPSYWIART